MMVLVCYDVSTASEGGPRRLRRVARVCQNHGQRVQHSVFECLVEPAQWTRFRARLLEEADLAQDSLPLFPGQELRHGGAARGEAGFIPRAADRLTADPKRGRDSPGVASR